LLTLLGCWGRSSWLALLAWCCFSAALHVDLFRIRDIGREFYLKKFLRKHQTFGSCRVLEGPALLRSSLDGGPESDNRKSRNVSYCFGAWRAHNSITVHCTPNGRKALRDLVVQLPWAEARAEYGSSSSVCSQTPNSCERTWRGWSNSSGRTCAAIPSEKQKCGSISWPRQIARGAGIRT
jgi:hypothetical protein